MRCPRPVRCRVMQGGDDAEGAQHAGVVVRDGLAGPGGRSIGIAGDAHVPADRLREHVVAPLRRVGPGLAERGDGGVDEPRIDALQLLVAEAEALHRADAEFSVTTSACFNQLAEQLEAGRRLQIEG